MTEESTNTQNADILNLRPEDLDELLTRAAERGAERALSRCRHGRCTASHTALLPGTGH